MTEDTTPSVDYDQLPSEVADLRNMYISRTRAALIKPSVAEEEFDTTVALLVSAVTEAADKPAPCVMTHTEPFDFAQCTTHDKTFALGDTCPWDGVESITSKLQDDVDEQRRLKVRAQFELEQLQVRLAGHVPVPCARCGSKPVLVPDTDPENLMDMRICWDCELIVGREAINDAYQRGLHEARSQAPPACAEGYQSGLAREPHTPRAGSQRRSPDRPGHPGPGSA